MDIVIKDLRKAFGENTVLNGVDLTLKDHGVYCLMGPSGTGKTTLLRILLGLEQPDSGSVTGSDGIRVSAVFQEDRLLDTLSPVDNICLVCGDFASRETVRKNLLRILPEECLDQPVRELSGGMKRRAALARAAWYPSKLMILDEPFTGLDIKTKDNVIRYLLDMRRNRTMIVATHAPDDAGKLNGTVIRLDPEAVPEETV